uniref:Methylthioribulose-1-phosphate dehydratase n=1 Tax=Sus scrofa TaxID=9823 RepID=A0A480FNI5_PIG
MRLRGWASGQRGPPGPAFRLVRPASGLPSTPPDCISGLAVLAPTEGREQSLAKTGGRGYLCSRPCLAVTLQRETVARGNASRSQHHFFKTAS